MSQEQKERPIFNSLEKAEIEADRMIEEQEIKTVIELVEGGFIVRPIQEEEIQASKELKDFLGLLGHDNQESEG